MRWEPGRDSNRCLLEWKTTTARYPEEPEGLLALDPQLICVIRWISGISDVAVVAFVRKRVPGDSISQGHDQRRTEAGVRPDWSEPRSARSKPASSSRTAAFAFRRTAVSSCAQLGLCLGNQQLVDAKLVRPSWSQ